jgi:RNA polymerase sigma factor (sigma-70 family)
MSREDMAQCSRLVQESSPATSRPATPSLAQTPSSPQLTRQGSRRCGLRRSRRNVDFCARYHAVESRLGHPRKAVRPLIGVRVGTGPDDEVLAHELWRAHAEELVRYATLLVGPADAADVVSIAYLKAADKLAAVEDTRSYLFRAVTNTAIDQARSTRRRQVRDLLAVLPAATSDPTSDPDVRRAVASLSVQQRAVVYFTFWHDLTSDEVADVLGIAPTTVRRHLARARVHLRKALT